MPISEYIILHVYVEHFIFANIDFGIQVDKR